MGVGVGSSPRTVGGGSTKEAIIKEALQLVADEGLHGLTLRPLAQRSGVSVATVRHHLGDKASLLQEVLASVVSSDLAFLESWDDPLRAWCESTASRASFAYIALVDAYLDRHLVNAVLVLSVLHDAERTPELSPLLENWLRGWRRALGVLLAHADLQEASLLVAYLIDDLMFSLTLYRDPNMRMLRFASLQRIFHTDDAVRGDQARDLFLTFHDRLAPSTSTLDRIADVSEKRRPLRDAAAAIALSDGISAVTHRGVAALAGVQPSTVFHHLGGRDDLVVAALEGVIAAFKGRLGDNNTHKFPGDDAEGSLRAVQRGTHGVALAALTRPPLREHAADMRRRRGENVVPGAPLPDGTHVPLSQDRLGAHLAACCAFGGLCVNAALPGWLDLSELLTRAHNC